MKLIIKWFVNHEIYNLIIWKTQNSLPAQNPVAHGMIKILFFKLNYIFNDKL